MPYLNVELDYLTHRKTVRLIGLLGPHAPLYPIRLWAYVGKHHCEDGSFKGYSIQEIESILAWKGKKGGLLDALTTVGYLDKVVEGEAMYYQVHDWLDHAGHLAALKKRGKANAEKRWSNLAKVDARPDATSIASAMLPLNLLGAGASAPPNRKCAAHDKGENCQEYAIAGSKYCREHKAFYLSVQERLSGTVPS